MWLYIDDEDEIEIGYEGLTPTMKAVAEGDIEKCEILLNSNASDDKKVLQEIAAVQYEKTKTENYQTIKHLIDANL